MSMNILVQRTKEAYIHLAAMGEHQWAPLDLQAAQRWPCLSVCDENE